MQYPFKYPINCILFYLDEEINEMALLSLTETMITQLFTKIGQRSIFLKKLGELKDLKV